jgi:type III pantothenate kinase
LNLLVDVGNTRTKWVLEDNGRFLSEVGYVLNEDIESSDLLGKLNQVKHVLVANVAGKAMESRLLALFQHSKVPARFVQSTSVACGVVNRYSRPNRLGVDRWLSLIAAYDMYNANCLVVNAGTAVTIDALMVNHYENNVEFIGGVILPGIHLMLNALNTHAAQLPKALGKFDAFAKNTDDAMQSGCILAILGAIELQWHKLFELIKVPPKLLISGGDAMVVSAFLPADLSEYCVVVDNLVLHGLMRLEREVA